MYVCFVVWGEVEKNETIRNYNINQDNPHSKQKKIEIQLAL